MLFAALIMQLGRLQVMEGANFQAMVNSTDKKIVTGNVPRGMILDAKGRVLVGNSAKPAITYTKNMNVLADKMYTEANQLTKYLTVSTDKLTERDQIDYYLSNPRQLKKWNAKLPKSAKVASDGSELPEKEIYQSTIKLVKKSFKGLNDQQKQAAAIFKIMSGAYQLSTVYIKNSDVTDQEIAQVSEHLTSLPGVNVGTDWERAYPNGNSMRSIIGHVSTEEQGLPEDGINSLLAQGYSRNDRVGTSYLEKQYEGVLHGSKSQSQVEVGANNQILSSSVLFKGQKGSNLNLTIDQAYQTQVEAALKKVYNQAKSTGTTQYSDGAYAVAMNPKTGAILAMAGESNDRQSGEIADDALGVINHTFVMGSAIKGATVMGGLMDGVITPTNNTLPDTPIYLTGTPVKKSVYPVGTFGALDAESALEVSSNIYMMHLAMLEGHAKYVPNQTMTMAPDIFTKMRGYFNQFGLGQKTGIDLPGEASGIEGPTVNEYGEQAVGSLLDLSYGNYDAYTLIQLAQYISTIANGGQRMQPYLVDSIQQTGNDGSFGQIGTKTTPTVLSTINAPESYFNVVKKGMYNVVNGTNAWGTAHTLKDIKPTFGVKTGTAQSFARQDPNDSTSKQVETVTSSLVGFAPYDNPQIAIAIVFPNLNTDEGHYNTLLAREMITDYYKLNNITK
ncbi:transpeptidase penicillin-binding protein 2B [Latilactobacillus graminis DSM 20719]|uniref:Transpeptidase penicillin-binding protein 2B n=1 Tax=Latilactobacillus graminis DSM 20719 TaxID=1423752 RepID=A0AA89I053_9LACO|nr:transpeptidase penicillin-binding protein 2B [Latilactobacillus graminis DSM 20719]